MQDSGSQELDYIKLARYAVATDIGLKRSDNQDSFGILEGDSVKIYLVADGMGGAQGGKVASEMAIELFKAALRGCTVISREVLIKVISDVHQAIADRSHLEPDLTGMGTTLVGLAFEKTKAYFFNVGDSRLYRISDQKISRCTEDHTVVQELLKTGAITEDQARNHPVSHMLTRSLGPCETVKVDCEELPEAPRTGDKFILCSDGLHTHVSSEDLLQIASECPIDQLVKKLIDLANERGGKDNITVLAVELGSGTNPIIEAEVTAIPEKKQDTEQESPAKGESIAAELSDQQFTIKQGAETEEMKLSDQQIKPVDLKSGRWQFVLFFSVITVSLISIIFLAGNFLKGPENSQQSKIQPAKSSESLTDTAVKPEASPLTEPTRPVVKAISTVNMEAAVISGEQAIKDRVGDLQLEISEIKAILDFAGFSAEQRQQEMGRQASLFITQKDLIAKLKAEIVSTEQSLSRYQAFLDKVGKTEIIKLSSEVAEDFPRMQELLSLFNLASIEYSKAVEDKVINASNRDVILRWENTLARRKQALQNLETGILAELNGKINELRATLESQKNQLEMTNRELKNIEKRISLFEAENLKVESAEREQQKSAYLEKLRKRLEDSEKSRRDLS